MTIVLMNTRHHRAIQIEHPMPSIVVPVELVSGQIAEAVFVHKDGSTLFGDPIYWQVSGPEIPLLWWKF